MKNYTRGKIEGKPGYRTPSTFIARKKLEVQILKTKFRNRK
jgi:hypothetical protein